MDCIEGMKLLDDNSIDSIVTDPPYELNFMGKKWDGTGIANNVEMWQECLRVLKPGGHLLSFGGSRTYHRMACAIEDAGFEIRDCIMWLYGSGFPKSHDISKAIDKAAGAERPLSAVQRPIGGKNGVFEGQGGNWGETTKEPQTPEAIQWNGWGTALKPAHEPIVLARKPLSESTVAANVLKWGTGGLNIDGCRIDLNGEKPPTGSGKPCPNGNADMMSRALGNRGNTTPVTGRFPANLLFDEEAAAMLDEQSGKVSYGNKQSGYTYAEKEYEVKGFVKSCKPKAPSNYGDSGGASRFFYCAKASKKERGEGNNHPTVKPIALMRYLVRLVTPPNGIVLDPFTGSGTTLIASKLEGFTYLGIEQEQQYCEIARKRVQSLFN